MTFVTFIEILLAVSAALSTIMVGGWLVWRGTRNSGWIDTIWTFGLGAVSGGGALSPAALGAALSYREVLVASLVVVWSLRLGLHIGYRTSGITDDPRYATLIRSWGADAVRQMFWLAQKQALVSVPLALSIVLAAFNPAPELRPQDWLGAAVLLIGVLGETIADSQLRRFRADPANRNRVCDGGLWRWSRHPNYFFEWFGWLAYPLIALDAADGFYPWAYAAIAGPLCMYWLLVHVSGIPPLEAHMLERHRDEFRAYQARTNAFFPAPPRTPTS